MVERVTIEETTYNELPFKFEAGTTNYMGAIGMATALDYISGLGLEAIGQYENALSSYAEKQLRGVPGLHLFGTARDRISIFSFLIDGIHAHDAGMILDKMGVAVRTGTH